MAQPVVDPCARETSRPVNALRATAHPGQREDAEGLPCPPRHDDGVDYSVDVWRPTDARGRRWEFYRDGRYIGRVLVREKGQVYAGRLRMPLGFTAKTGLRFREVIRQTMTEAAHVLAGHDDDELNEFLSASDPFILADHARRIASSLGTELHLLQFRVPRPLPLP